jgi:hypothetical protein
VIPLDEEVSDESTVRSRPGGSRRRQWPGGEGERNWTGWAVVAYNVATNRRYA